MYAAACHLPPTWLSLLHEKTETEKYSPSSTASAETPADRNAAMKFYTLALLSRLSFSIWQKGNHIQPASKQYPKSDTLADKYKTLNPLSNSAAGSGNRHSVAY